MFYYTKIMSNLFIDAEINRTRHNFRDLATKQDLWQVFVIFPQQQSNVFKLFLIIRYNSSVLDDNYCILWQPADVE